MTTIAQRPARAWAAGHRALLTLVSLVVAAAVTTVVAVLTISGAGSSTGTQIHYQHVVDTCNRVAPSQPC